MNRKTLFIAALVSAATAQFANAASDGSINFNGELVAQTCTIAVDGVVTPAIATVTLPTASTGNLVTPGEVAGQTGFNIQLSECVGTAKTAAASSKPVLLSIRLVATCITIPAQRPTSNCSWSTFKTVTPFRLVTPIS